MEDESVYYMLPNHMMIKICSKLPIEMMQGILACCKPLPPSVKQSLRASKLQAMVSKCGSEISGHIPALEYITYDPNSKHDDGSDDEYSDDVNRKGRRAAAKCIEAVIISRHEMIEQSCSHHQVPWSHLSTLCNSDIYSGSRKEKKM